MQDESTAGNSSGSKYEARFTETFLKATKHIRRDDLKAVLTEILASPYTARKSELLRHEWAGFRSAVYQAGDRILYRVCEECERLHMKAQSPLDCCLLEECDPMVVTFVHFGDYHRSSGRRRITPPRHYDVVEPT